MRVTPTAGIRYACGFGMRQTMDSPPRIVKCPQCGASVAWTPESKWRPFCSERCKTLDLGAWASERYRIETAEPTAPDDRSPDTRPGDDR
jgi:hypothetical protein